MNNSINYTDESIFDIQPEATLDSRRPLLIIDDNKDLLDALNIILKRSYDLLFSNSYQDAEMKIQNKIQVALLDIKMAHTNGIEAFSLLKAKSPNLKIIFHSAYPGNNEQALLAESLPHFGYLIKGEYDIGDLLQTLERVFAK